ncbi:MAG: acyltransferase [Bacteroidetes bacterium]|nr:acyltransferase [Bacteroidota bacterium]
MKKFHFHSLDALRFFAFLKVYFLHVPVQGNFPVFGLLKSGGGIGVCFFFVLSGFLITYLLSHEKLHVGQIDFKKFLIRRTLRIWPLYFLVVLVVFMLPYGFKESSGLHMVGGGYNFDWRYSFTFFENYKMLLVDNFPKTTPLSVFWSLCIEEHFYIVWLIGLFLLPSKYIFRFLSGCFVVAIAARLIEPHLFAYQVIDANDLFTNMDYFASGGLLGYLVARDYEAVAGFIQKIYAWVKYLVILLVIIVVIFQSYFLPNVQGSFFSYIRPTVISVMFTILLSLFIPKDSRIRINSKVLNYLGTISFGLYVYHLIFVHMVFQYCIHHKILIDNWITLSTYILITLGGTIGVSMVSYHFFEKPFLSLREKWTLKKVAVAES